MQWQYKTVIIEFQKDGLLGEKYIDEEETEAVLNECGASGWELATATMVPEGLLLCCKQEAASSSSQPKPAAGPMPEASAEDKPEDGSPLGNIRIF